MSVRVVVASAIVRAGKVLVAQRSYPPEHRGLWEFPGGGVEVGETEQRAVVRECREELGVEVTALRRIGPQASVGAERVLRLWLARLDAGEPRAAEHLAVSWVGVDDLTGVDFLAADLVFLPALKEALSQEL